MSTKTLSLLVLLSACAASSGAFAHSGESPAQAGPYWFELVDEYGSRLQTHEYGGRTYVLGEKSMRYEVRVHNDSARRIEAVVSVDGRDVLDGKNSAVGKRGYVIGAHDQVTISGFRLNYEAVAAFRFSSVGQSYAAQTGDARNVGVIGVAIFPERAPEPVYVPTPRPYPRYPYYPSPSYEEREGLLSDAAPERKRAMSGSAPPSAVPLSPPIAKSAPRAEPSGGARSMAPPADDRPGLGTEFGEARSSHVTTTTFRRARNHPDHVLTMRYNDRRGLVALGVIREYWDNENAELHRRETARPFGQAGFSAPPPGWVP